ncbi:orphan sodium- and chloride-dependent neurotransmitter transporter NTT5 isoform X3 [Falco rusticolus]|uniref:orphan sodium- and chloride-dependent neurotransmitter transporter NTT5 isoform X3 n=1 Tax=Falco rusticolus TaxID=120794 RepID=UPI00188694B5|nr:orphan sodium- and chloride-dependent neurotransmitter transporter NTT5 isoform X3 [Falco rusticolus]
MQKAQPVLRGNTGPLQEEPPPRPAWTSKAQYILAQLGFSVGLGNVWRFPYLCHQNGGGAFLLLYLLLLFLLGIPLLFLELAAGQCLRQGSVGVWKSISPRLAGIGLASCLVCVFVALYYNVIIAWSLLYLAHSFQHPLPWQSCPSTGPNLTEPECALSSPTTYFWCCTSALSSPTSSSSASWCGDCCWRGPLTASASCSPPRNVELVAQAVASGGLPEHAHPPGNLTALLGPQYSTWLRGLPPALRDTLGVTDCRVEEEMNKGVEGPGLAFIVFTETLTLLPAAPLWSCLFFLTLLGLGLGTMLGITQAVLTPLLDAFLILRRRRALLTVLCCAGGFVLGLPFTQRSGSYLVAAFDDYVATLPLLAVAACEAVAVAWVYGAERFLAAVGEVTGHRPWRLYGPLWRFGSPGAMVALLGASLGQLALQPPTYQAWDRTTATLQRQPYPPWALALALGLMVVAVLPIPLIALRWALRPPQAPPGPRDQQGNKEEEEEEEGESAADPAPLPTAPQGLQEREHAPLEDSGERSFPIGHAA